MAGMVHLAALFAIQAGWTADGIQKKTRPTGYVFKCKRSKRRKLKEKGNDVFKEITIVASHHNVSVPLFHLKVLFESSLSFAPLIRACAEQQSFATVLIG